MGGEINGGRLQMLPSKFNDLSVSVSYECCSE